ncbi:MAG: hypothetical protein FWF90_00240 [Promicromonosporaceae bacterium]|nr:hypothetical protein [Promicromonosporaceae bacterium]
MTTRKAARRRRRAVVAAAVTVVLAGGVGAGVWALRHRPPTPVTERCSASLSGTDWYLSPEQADNAALVAGISVQRALPPRAATIALATALQESKLINITYGDRDSLGLFQQRPSQGWGTAAQVQDPVWSTNKFYDALLRVPGYQNLDITVAAQKVQHSGYPSAYAQHEVRARAWASGLTGESPGTVSCELDPVRTPHARSAAEHTFQALAQRDLGLPAGDVHAGTAADGSVWLTVDAHTLVAGDPGRAAWAAAQWAVTTASATDVVEVRVADRAWTRDGAVLAARKGTAPWTSADGQAPAAGEVRVRLATSG